MPLLDKSDLKYDSIMNVVDNRSKQADSIIPNDLNVSDYQAVLDYYGISD